MELIRRTADLLDLLLAWTETQPVEGPINTTFGSMWVTSSRASVANTLVVISTSFGAHFISG